MNKGIKSVTVFFLVAFSFSCSSPVREMKVDPAQEAEAVHKSIRSLNDIIIYEIFSPPVSSRIYAYASLAIFESIRWSDSSYPSLVKQMSGFPEMPRPEAGKKYHFTVAAVKAMLDVTDKFTFNKDSLRLSTEKILQSLKSNGIDDETFNNSITFGASVAKAILKRASGDQYLETRGMARYTVNPVKGKWKTTGPDYLDAVEPFWSKMKPLVMDSCSQFKPVPPPPVDLDKKSGFYKEMEEVYETGKNLTEEQKTIAMFWDDNPAAITHAGHVMYANKKASPGGHWMNITAISCRKEMLDALASAQTYAVVGTIMYDAFISCWDEKFRSEYIRPITIINETIDQQWQPFLQTPPFPEYTSGHSVVSSAIATVLTKTFGDNFAFTDDYEQPYIGITRSFSSFQKASEEACISRLYGGIHFRSAIENGRQQGRSLGEYYCQKIEWKPIPKQMH